MPTTDRITHLTDNEIALLDRQIEDGREIDKLRAENRLLKAKIVCLVQQLRDAQDVLDRYGAELGR